MAELLTIGEVAGKRAGVATSALRFYEREHLIEATRSEGGQRLDYREVLRRIAFIGAAQRVGLSLEEITDVLAVLAVGEDADRSGMEAPLSVMATPALTCASPSSSASATASTPALAAVASPCRSADCPTPTTSPPRSARDHAGSSGRVYLPRRWTPLVLRSAWSRREGVWVGAGATLASLIERSNCGHLHSVEFEVKYREILCDARRRCTLFGRDDVAVLHVPPQHDLCGRAAKVGCDRRDHRICERLSLRERRPRLGNDPTGLPIGSDFGIVEVRMHLDLVDRRDEVALDSEAFEVGNLQVRDSDRAREVPPDGTRSSSATWRRSPRRTASATANG